MVVTKTGKLYLTLAVLTLVVGLACAIPAPAPAATAINEDDTFKVDKSKFRRPRIHWFIPPDRTCPIENDFCELPKPAKMPSKAQRRQFASMHISNSQGAPGYGPDPALPEGDYELVGGPGGGEGGGDGGGGGDDYGDGDYGGGGDAGGGGGDGAGAAGGAGGGQNPVLEALGHVNGALGSIAKAGESANGIIAGAISNLHGIGGLIRGGIDLAKVFGLGPVTRAIFVDNRCPACDLWVRCTSQNKDSGWIPLEHPDGYIMKFVTHLPGWEYGLGNFGFVFWTCEHKDEKTGRVIRHPAFGGQAPRETINLFEVRTRGLFRMDQETGRIDARQPVIMW